MRHKLAVYFLILLCIISLTPASNTKAATIEQSRGKFILVLPGFNTTSGEASGFEDVLASLRSQYPDAIFFRYSYNGPAVPYTPFETAFSVSTAADIVGEFLQPDAIRNRDVYLAGHSLGGVVASLYAARFSGFPAESGARLAGVITLDSPLQGLDTSAPCFPQWAVGLGDLLGGDFSGSSIAQDLTPGSDVITALQQSVRNTSVLTISSQQDCAIRWTTASLPHGTNVLVDAGEDGWASHSAVLHNQDAIRQLVQFVASTPSPVGGLEELSVTQTSPPNNQRDMAVSTKISITFNKQFNLDDVPYVFVGDMKYSVSLQGTSLVFDPQEPLKPGGHYSIILQLARTGGRPELYEYAFTTVGPTVTPLPDTRPADIAEIEAADRRNRPDLYLSNQVERPYPNQDFSIMYEYKYTPTGHFAFTVTLRGGDKSVARSKFISWMKSLQLTDNQIATLDITYR